MLCAWSHLDVSKWLYEQALEGGWTQLGPVTGLSTGLPASRKCSHLTEISEGAGPHWERMKRDRNGESHLQVNGTREHVGMGVYMGGSLSADGLHHRRP